MINALTDVAVESSHFVFVIHFSRLLGTFLLIILNNFHHPIILKNSRIIGVKPWNAHEKKATWKLENTIKSQNWPKQIINSGNTWRNFVFKFHDLFHLTDENSLDFELSTFQCYTRFIKARHLFSWVSRRQIEFRPPKFIIARIGCEFIKWMAKTQRIFYKSFGAYWRCKKWRKMLKQFISMVKNQ